MFIRRCSLIILAVAMINTNVQNGRTAGNDQSSKDNDIIIRSIFPGLFERTDNFILRSVFFTEQDKLENEGQ